MEEKLAAWRLATGKANVDNSATAKIFGTKKKSPLVPSTSHNTSKTTHLTGASSLTKKPAQRPVVPKLAGPSMTPVPLHCPISPACTDKENSEAHVDAVTAPKETQEEEEAPQVSLPQEQTEVTDEVSNENHQSEPETNSVDEAPIEPENTPSVPETDGEAKSQPLVEEAAGAPPCSPQEQTKERRRRRTTMFVKGNATPDDARSKGQPSPLLQSPGLVAARKARRASGGTVLFRDAPAAAEATASEDVEAIEPPPIVDTFHQSEQKLARLSEGSRESQSDSSSCNSSGHASVDSSGPPHHGSGDAEKIICDSANDYTTRRVSGAASDRSSLGSESLTTASPYSGHSTRSSLDGATNGEATSIADFFSPFSPEARARYRTAARDNVVDPENALGDAAAGGGGSYEGCDVGGSNQTNGSSSASSLADEQQWAEAAAAWEAAAEAMKTSYENEFAKLEAETSAQLATAEAQVGMAQEEQAMLHFLAEVQKQEGEMRAAAFSKTLDQLHSKVILTSLFLGFLCLDLYFIHNYFISCISSHSLQNSYTYLWQHQRELKDLRAEAESSAAKQVEYANALTAQMKEGLLAAVKQCKILEKNTEEHRYVIDCFALSMKKSDKIF